MAHAFIKLPDDSSNSGKNIRTESVSVSATTVHQQYVIPAYSPEFAGKYFFSSTQQSVSATIQDATATGFFWLQNPAGSDTLARIHSITIDANTSSTVVAPTAPVISFAKFTFTGTAGGASVTPVFFQTAGAANEMVIRTAVTGMTVTLVGSVGSFSVPTVLTGVGNVYASKDVLPYDPIGFTGGVHLEIDEGEGLVVYQSVAGTVADPRRFGVQIRWSESN